MADENKTKASSSGSTSSPRHTIVTQSGGTKAAKAKATAAGVPTEGINVDGDAGAAEVQARVDAEQEKGYRGVVTDPTPNEHYTVEGVTSGKPTPETDADLFLEARAASLGNPHENVEFTGAQVRAIEEGKKKS